MERELNNNKKEFEYLKSISEGTRINKGYYNYFHSIVKGLLDSKEINSNEKMWLIAILINTYKSEYKYEEAEEVVNYFINENIEVWELLYVIGEYYTITRRYDKAIEFFEKGLKLDIGVDEKSELDNKLYNCIGRRDGKNKEYLPAPNDAREKYKCFLEGIGIKVELPKRIEKNPLEISKEDYPCLVEKTDLNFDSFVSFDLETTGFANYDEIIEIGAVKVINGEIVDRFSSLVKPNRYLKSRITEITGITNEMVQNELTIDKVLREFIEFIGDEILLGHNVISFDSRFLFSAGRKNGLVIKNSFFDVMKFAKSINCKSKLFDKYNLGSLCSQLGVENLEAHRALSDAEATAKVFLKLVNL